MKFYSIEGKIMGVLLILSIGIGIQASVLDRTYEYEEVIGLKKSELYKLGFAFNEFKDNNIMFYVIYVMYLLVMFMFESKAKMKCLSKWEKRKAVE